MMKIIIAGIISIFDALFSIAVKEGINIIIIAIVLLIKCKVTGNSKLSVAKATNPKYMPIASKGIKLIGLKCINAKIKLE